tara:strand:+ start:790 stop:1482 length:693 start_codon:yes stop_codon:yes gene_type:complete
MKKTILLSMIFTYALSNDIFVKDGKYITVKDDGNWEYIDELQIISWEDAIDKAEYKKILDVPVYTQSTNAPPDGWCGQTSIQMILDYYGHSYTQEEINRARVNTDNPTIFFEDMVPTIEKLTNNKFKVHAARFWSEDNYKNWIKSQIDKNKPVMAVFKMNPTKHPNWLIDHFSIISGYDNNGIYILTTWKDNAKQYRTWEQLLAKANNDLSFVGSRKFVEKLFIGFDIYK